MSSKASESYSHVADLKLRASLGESGGERGTWKRREEDEEKMKRHLEEKKRRKKDEQNPSPCGSANFVSWIGISCVKPMAHQHSPGEGPQQILGSGEAWGRA
ncbi:hypothetical protein llap_2798 [Limosa lapponica baueri]|uniref:Uncharacterized protein n=1 Tax=Limosa lapponica baueri TaxID=1758121 RepID=A0A2I0ULH9_LIMLA|nr:hypothetical protein llap_2798 [Limosa lapponica baueri]